MNGIRLAAVVITAFSSWTSISTAVAQARPAAPGIVSIERVSVDTARVALVDVVDVTGYNVYRGADYVTTVRPALGVTDFTVNSGSRGGDICLVAFIEVVQTAGAEPGGTLYSECSDFVTLGAADPDAPDVDPAGPPTTPGTLRAVVYSAGVIELFWERSRDDGRVVAYRVTRDGEEITVRDGRSFFEPSLSAEQEYAYAVTAIDDEGNESEPAILLVVPSDGDTVPPDTGDDGPPPADSGDGQVPATPVNLRSAVYSPGVAEIFWDRSPDEGRLAGYELLRDGERVEFRRGRSYFDPSLEPGRLYVYTLFAVDRDGDRSEALTLAVRAGNPPAPESGFEVYLTPERVALAEGAAEVVDVDVLVIGAGVITEAFSIDILDTSGVALADLSVAFGEQTVEDDSSRSRLSLSFPVDMAPRLAQQRTLWIRVDDGEREVVTPLSLEIEPIDSPDVYLLIGQSNMEGYSEFGAKQAGPGEADEPIERVQQLHVKESNPRFFATGEDFVSETVNVNSPLFIKAEDPLHGRLWPGQPAKSGTFIGPGLSFGKATLATTDQTVYLVPAAWGATGFCANSKGDVAWNAETPDDPELGGTWLLDRALVRLEIAMRETGGILRGILWHQGGADSNNLRCGELYAENIVKMVERIRSEAPVDARGDGARGKNAAIPFIVATQSRGDDERGNYSFYGPPKVLVDSAHRSIGSLVPFADVVINDDLVPPFYPCGQSSCVHFGAAAMREQGKRFQAALERVRQSHADERSIIASEDAAAGN